MLFTVPIGIFIVATGFALVLQFLFRPSEDDDERESPVPTYWIVGPHLAAAAVDVVLWALPLDLADSSP